MSHAKNDAIANHFLCLYAVPILTGLYALTKRRDKRNAFFLADRTNSRAIGTVWHIRLSSVSGLCVRNVLWLNGA